MPPVVASGTKLDCGARLKDEASPRSGFKVTPQSDHSATPKDAICSRKDGLYTPLPRPSEFVCLVRPDIRLVMEYGHAVMIHFFDTLSAHRLSCNALASMVSKNKKGKTIDGVALRNLNYKVSLEHFQLTLMPECHKITYISTHSETTSPKYGQASTRSPPLENSSGHLLPSLQE